MPDATVQLNEPVWVDLSSSDPAAARAFYARLFGWDVVVSPDPQYGGYAMARVDNQDVAGIGPSQPGAPTSWAVYLGTDDCAALGGRVEAAGGRVAAPAFDVVDAGRMAVFEDPSGAFIAAWQPKLMGSFHRGGPGTFGWAELNARGLERAIPFYREVFGWSALTREMDTGVTPYTEFELAGQSIAGAMEMPAMVPAIVPSYWMVYFTVDDIDRSFGRALEAGAREILAPRAYPGGRLAILGDPQGAVFGLMTMTHR
jgi:hypothetical protein